MDGTAEAIFAHAFSFSRNRWPAQKKSIKPATSKFSSKRSYVFSLFFSSAILMSFLCSIFKSLHPLSQTHTSTKERERASLQLPGSMADYVLLQT